MKYLTKIVETYRVANEAEAAKTIEEAKHDPRFTLSKYEAIHKEKKSKGEIIDEDKDEQPLVNVSTTISDNYVQDEDLKIEIHKMINEIDSFEKLKEVKNIIIDRFGKYDENIESKLKENFEGVLYNESKIS